MEYHRLFACKLTLGHMKQSKNRPNQSWSYKETGAIWEHTKSYILFVIPQRKHASAASNLLFFFVCSVGARTNATCAKDLSTRFQAKGHFYHLRMTTFHGIIKP